MDCNLDSSNLKATHFEASWLFQERTTERGMRERKIETEREIQRKSEWVIESERERLEKEQDIRIIATQTLFPNFRTLKTWKWIYFRNQSRLRLTSSPSSSSLQSLPTSPSSTSTYSSNEATTARKNLSGRFSNFFERGWIFLFYFFWS